MLVYVQNIDKRPQMPTTAAKAKNASQASESEGGLHTPLTIRLT
jgi:hypothetical protein